MALLNIILHHNGSKVQYKLDGHYYQVQRMDVMRYSFTAKRLIFCKILYDVHYDVANDNHSKNQVSIKQVVDVTLISIAMNGWLVNIKMFVARTVHEMRQASST